MPLAPLSYGSKLIFDPYGYLDPKIFNRLGELFDKSIWTILLKRSYAALFTAWKLRGVHHELNADAVSKAASVDQQLVDVVSSWKSPKLKAMLITLGDAPLRGANPDAAGTDAINYPVEDAVEDLLVLFYNDLKALTFVQQQQQSHAVVDYDDIEGKFFSLARMVGSEASGEEIRHALGNPITKRLQVLEPELVQPPEFLQRLSDCLDRAFAVAVKYQTAEAVWQWSGDMAFIDLKVEGLAEVLSDYAVPYETSSPSSTALNGRSVRWPRLRPIYSLVGAQASPTVS